LAGGAGSLSRGLGMLFMTTPSLISNVELNLLHTAFIYRIQASARKVALPS